MEQLPYMFIMVILSILLYFAGRFSYHKNVILNESYIQKYSIFSKILLFAGYVYLILFSSFRIIDQGLGGIDALAYKNYFLGAIGGWKESITFQNYEVGYATVIWLIRMITDNYVVVLFVIYTFFYLTLLYYLKYITWSKSTILTIALLIALILNSFNTTRVIVGVFLGMLVYILLYKKKYIWALMLSFLAISMHVSALILLPMIVIYITVNNSAALSKKKLVLIIVGTSLLSILTLSILGSVISESKYHIYSDDGGVGLNTYIMIILITILSFVKHDEVVRINPFNKVLIILLPIGLIVLPMQVRFSILYRMILYFLPIMYGLIPSLLLAYRIDKLEKIYFVFIKIGLVLYMGLKIYIFFSVEVFSAGIPYFNALFMK